MAATREDRLREFYNSLDSQRTIAFMEDDKVEDSLSSEVFVENLHKDGPVNPRKRLLRSIEVAASADRYFFTGMRGSGKTTELLKLKSELEQRRFVAFYADMSEFLPESEPVRIGSFLLLLVSILADRVKERYDADFTTQSFWSEFFEFLTSEVKIDGIEWGVDTFLGKVGFKFKLKQNPSIRQELQRTTEVRLDTLVRAVNKLLDDIVHYIRRGSTTTRVIYLVDSVERLRGIGEKQSKEVFDSLENLFSFHADNLRFSTLSVIYTLPPYLRAVVGAGENNLICALPAIRIVQHPTPGDVAGEEPEPCPDGIKKMLDVLQARYAGWGEFFTEDDLKRLARDSGGDLREYFLLLRSCLTMVDSEDDDSFPIPVELVEQVEKERRNQFGMIPDSDMDWLKRVAGTHGHGKQSDDDTATLANLLDGKLMFQYRNGDNWYDIHPLLRERVKRHGEPAASGS